MAYTEAQLRSHIYEIQGYLYAISLRDANVPTIIPDGIYGKETKLAVRAFQREYNIDETGKINQETWDKIVSVYMKYVGSTPVAIDVFPSIDFTVNIGDRGALVYFIQVLLYSYGEKFDNVSTQNINGIYDRETETAIRIFQKRCNLPATGVVDNKTWNLLAGSIRQLL